MSSPGDRCGGVGTGDAAGVAEGRRGGSSGSRRTRRVLRRCARDQETDEDALGRHGFSVSSRAAGPGGGAGAAPFLMSTVACPDLRNIPHVARSRARPSR
ncbi:hypothetical protein ACFPM0_12870 [Pseudonocardia sulfidoxydans]|uniref:hypothetical protein n=1 Tax=Pseudonocardia sulfidoxydans TaxID=54011 RepID=UPI00361BD2DE